MTDWYPGNREGRSGEDNGLFSRGGTDAAALLHLVDDEVESGLNGLGGLIGGDPGTYDRSIWRDMIDLQEQADLNEAADLFKEGNWENAIRDGVGELDGLGDINIGDELADSFSKLDAQDLTDLERVYFDGLTDDRSFLDLDQLADEIIQSDYKWDLDNPTRLPTPRDSIYDMAVDGGTAAERAAERILRQEGEAATYSWVKDRARVNGKWSRLGKVLREVPVLDVALPLFWPEQVERGYFDDMWNEDGEFTNNEPIDLDDCKRFPNAMHCKSGIANIIDLFDFSPLDIEVFDDGCQKIWSINVGISLAQLPGIFVGKRNPKCDKRDLAPPAVWNGDSDYLPPPEFNLPIETFDVDDSHLNVNRSLIGRGPNGPFEILSYSSGISITSFTIGGRVEAYYRKVNFSRTTHYITETRVYFTFYPSIRWVMSNPTGNWRSNTALGNFFIAPQSRFYLAASNWRVLDRYTGKSTYHSIPFTPLTVSETWVCPHWDWSILEEGDEPERILQWSGVDYGYVWHGLIGTKFYGSGYEAFCFRNPPQPSPSPPPLLPPPPPMSCCDRTDRLLALLLSEIKDLRKKETQPLHQRYVADAWGEKGEGIKVPSTLITQENGDDRTITAYNWPQLFLWFVGQTDGLFGQWPIEIEVEQEQDGITPKKPIKVQLFNVAEAMAELYGLGTATAMDSDVSVAFLQRLAVEVMQIKTMSLSSSDYIRAIVDFMDFPGAEVARDLPMSFSAYKPNLNRQGKDTSEYERSESIRDVLKQTTVQVRGYEFQGESDTLTDAMQKLLYAAAIIKAVHVRNPEPGVDPDKDGRRKGGFLETIGDIASIINAVGTVKGLFDENGEPIAMDYEQFIKDLKNPNSLINRGFDPPEVRTRDDGPDPNDNDNGKKRSSGVWRG